MIDLQENEPNPEMGVQGTMTPTRVSGHIPFRLAWVTWVLYLVLAFATLTLQSANDPSLLLPNLFSVLVLLAFATVGALIATRRTGNPIGWLMCIGTLTWAAGDLALQYAIYALVTVPGGLPGGNAAGVLGGSLRGVGFGILLTYVLLLFPNGHLPSARWRPAVWFAIVTQVLFVIAVLLAPAQGVDPSILLIQSPVRVPLNPRILDSLAAILVLLGIISIIVCGVSVFSRFRHAQGDERQQLKWFAYAALMAIVILTIIETLSLLSLNPPLLNSILFSLAAVGFPAAIGIAMLKYRLYDIDLLINRTLVYLPLTAILAGVFAASISISQKLAAALTGQQSDAATVLTTLIVVAVFEPLKRTLQHLVDKRFKEVSDPSKQLQAFGAQVQAVAQVLDAPRLAQRLLDEALGAFGATGGAVYLCTGDTEQLLHASRDWNGDVTLDVAMENAGRRVGRLALGARRGGQGYGSPDRAALQQAATSVAEAIQLSPNGLGR